MSISDQTWISDLPKGWSILPLRHVLLERKELNKLRDETNILSVTNDRGVIRYADKGNIGNKASDDIERYKKVRKGDIVANSMNVIIGSVGIAPEDGVLSPVYIVMQPTPGVDIRYFNYIFKTKGFQSQLKRIGYGILEHRMRIPWDNLKVQALPNPPFKDQELIADYLDKETAKIDNLITKQERLLKLLEEKRRVTITNAVTRGLRRNIEFKKSAEWFPELPSHWKTSKLKYFTDLITDGTHITPNYIAEGIPFLSIKDISSGKIDFSDTKFISTAEHQILSKHAKIEKGDILFTRIGTLGVNVVVDTDEPFDIFVSLGLIKLFPGSINTNYLVFCMSSNYYLEYIQQVKAGGGTAAAKFNLGDVANSPIIVPPKNEQEEIVLFLNDYLIKHEKMVRYAMLQINLLKERRVSLISNVVTGKVIV